MTLTIGYSCTRITRVEPCGHRVSTVSKRPEFDDALIGVVQRGGRDLVAALDSGVIHDGRGVDPGVPLDLTTFEKLKTWAKAGLQERSGNRCRPDENRRGQKTHPVFVA